MRHDTFGAWSGDLDELWDSDDSYDCGPHYVFTAADRVLHDAVGANDVAGVRAALRGGGSPNAVREHEGSILEAAAVRADVATVALLLAHGATDEPTGLHGACGSAVAAAAHHGRDDILRTLLAAGCSARPPPGRNGPALTAAVLGRGGAGGAVALLVAHGADPAEQRPHCMYATALQAAASRGNAAAVSALLRAGAPVNIRGGYHGNALQAAARNGFLDVVELLLRAGADPTQQCGVDGSALRGARDRGHVAVARRLEAAIRDWPPAP